MHYIFPFKDFVWIIKHLSGQFLSTSRNINYVSQSISRIYHHTLYLYLYIEKNNPDRIFYISIYICKSELLVNDLFCICKARSSHTHSQNHKANGIDWTEAIIKQKANKISWAHSISMKSQQSNVDLSDHSGAWILLYFPN